jgi:hypothetical protein
MARVLDNNGVGGHWTRLAVGLYAFSGPQADTVCASTNILQHCSGKAGLRRHLEAMRLGLDWLNENRQN